VGKHRGVGKLASSLVIYMKEKVGLSHGLYTSEESSSAPQSTIGTDETGGGWRVMRGVAVIREVLFPYLSLSLFV